MKEIEYYWNFDEFAEAWYESASSIKECLEEAKLYDSTMEYVYIGESDEYNAAIDGELLLDRLSDQAYYEVGEVSDNWLDGVTREQYNELSLRLSSTLNIWLYKHNLTPTFGAIINVKKYDL